MKIISLILLLSILVLCTFCSCSLINFSPLNLAILDVAGQYIDNGITPFGDIAFANQGYWLYQDTGVFLINGEYYYDVGSAEDGVERGEYIAAMNNEADQYSYRVYKPSDESLTDILIINFYSKLNLCDYDRIYTLWDVESVPADMLYDFPHKDDWFCSGMVTEMYGINYCSYHSTVPGGVTAGEKLFDFEGREYFSFPDQPLWILSPNESDPTMYDVFYDTDRVTELPGDVIRALNISPNESSR